MDVIIGPDEPRYWVALGACVLGSALLFRATSRMKGDGRRLRWFD